MWQLVVRGVIAGVIVVGVTVLSNRSRKMGAFLLTLPLVSILAFISAWYGRGDLNGISRLARETLILVPLGLPFFIPLAFAQRLGLGFWTAFVAGLALASVPIGCWLWIGPKSLKGPTLTPADFFTRLRKNRTFRPPGAVDNQAGVIMPS